MTLPFFYLPVYNPGDTEIVLDEDNSRHIVQVLRMQKDQQLQLTDGHGRLLTATILDDHKKKCRVRIDNSLQHPPREKKIIIALSLLKNTSRFEWFLEKATEIGVAGIIPLLSLRTEKQHFREDRLQSILISALLQSQQTWLPQLLSPTPIIQLIRETTAAHRFIAHCLETDRRSLAEAIHRAEAAHRADQEPSAAGSSLPAAGNDQLILIGPEGDFTPEEIDTALKNGFLPVTLGETRLRTETAGVVAAALMCIR